MCVCVCITYIDMCVLCTLSPNKQNNIYICSRVKKLAHTEMVLTLSPVWALAGWSRVHVPPSMLGKRRSREAGECLETSIGRHHTQFKGSRSSQ
jgi:hypothetical protein